MKSTTSGFLGLFLLASAASIACDRPPVDVKQMNFRGLGIENVQNPRRVAARIEANQAPAPQPPAQPGTPLTSTVYKNVQVLGDLEVAEFARLMVAITSWVSPEQGCTYCHTADLASDEKYTKVVARRMLQMTQDINSNWSDHIRTTGVTCYTCHRGQPLPAEVWSTSVPARSGGMLGNKAGQNTPAASVGLTSLPMDPFSAFLTGSDEIRVQSKTALPSGDLSSIKETEWTYGFMMHISESLGVNCTYCHNTRSFMPWEASSPARVNAWYAIRMLRQVNDQYIGPLADVLPPNRKGPAGDALKANCATCHRGLAKPLNGANMLKDYPALGGVRPIGHPGTTGSLPSPPLRSAQR